MRLAQDVAAVLQAGDLIALSGGLGAGKTTFARALLRSLSGDAALEVQSPTFPLRLDHALPRFTVTHADLYRLGDRGELDEIGLEDAIGEGALLVEWPERLPQGLSDDRLDLSFEIDGEGRSVEIAAHGNWPARLARTARIRAFLERSGLAWRIARAACGRRLDARLRANRFRRQDRDLDELAGARGGAADL